MLGLFEREALADDARVSAEGFDVSRERSTFETPQESMPPPTR